VLGRPPRRAALLVACLLTLARPASALDVKLWPLFRYAHDEANDVVRWSAFGPILEFTRTPEARDLRIRPLLWLRQQRGGERDDQADILFPLISTRWQNDYQTFRFLLFTYSNRPAPKPETRAPTWATRFELFPFVFYRSSPAPAAGAAFTASSSTRTPWTSGRRTRGSAARSRSSIASAPSARPNIASGASPRSMDVPTARPSRRASTRGRPTASAARTWRTSTTSATTPCWSCGGGSGSRTRPPGTASASRRSSPCAGASRLTGGRPDRCRRSSTACCRRTAGCSPCGRRSTDSTAGTPSRMAPAHGTWPGGSSRASGTGWSAP